MKISLAFLLMMISSDIYAEIYKWVDAEGNAHFSQNINDVPKDQEVKEAKIKASNSSQSTVSKTKPKSGDKDKGITNQYTSKQLEEKCGRLSRIWALDPNGFNSPSYRESRRLGCGKAAWKRLKNQ
jgi:hypothetical protein